MIKTLNSVAANYKTDNNKQEKLAADYLNQEA
jgi:hypothetical protein